MSDKEILETCFQENLYKREFNPFVKLNSLSNTLVSALSNKKDIL